MAEGMRPITVDGQAFRWRFDDYVVVIPADKSSPQLIVEWGWKDWLEPGGPGNEPVVVTPKLVAAAIRFAITNGWAPEKSGPPFKLGYVAGSFRTSAH
jgi:hypothetical protein